MTQRQQREKELNKLVQDDFKKLVALYRDAAGGNSDAYGAGYGNDYGDSGERISREEIARPN